MAPGEFFGTGGDDTLTGTSQDDTLFGGDGNDTLFAGSGNDILVGGAGGDTLDGGDGADTASYEGANAAVRADLVKPEVNLNSAAGDSYVSIEHLVGTSLGDGLRGDFHENTLFGGAGNDALYGRAGNDTLIGGTGSDVLNGGTGIDAASYALSATALLLDLENAALNTGEAAGDIYYFIEKLVGSTFSDTLFGTSGADTLVGGSGNDTLTGRAGDDVLTGGAGTDTIFGGDGSDTLSYATATSGVLADLEGNENNTGDAAGDVYSSVENLAGSAFDDILRGDNSENILIGSAGNDSILGRGGKDTLIGGSGADILNGGSETDTASYADAVASVRADLDNSSTNTNDAAGDIYGSIENLIGTRFGDGLLGNGTNNVLYGEDGDDALYGRGGDDTLFGGAGADLFHGSSGTDTVSYATAGLSVRADLQFPNVNLNEALGDTYTLIENLIGTALGDGLRGDVVANAIFGGNGDDIIYGRSGDDVLIGGLGADTIFGGPGSDWVSYSDAASGVTVDLDDEGENTGEAFGDVFDLVENLIGSDDNDTLLGGLADNVILGGSGDDFIHGCDGADSLDGGAGADILIGSAGIDVATYQTSLAGVTADLLTPANNTGDAAGDQYFTLEGLTGSNFDDTLTGDAADNTLSGASGADTLNGGSGNDHLDGGSGADQLFGGDGSDWASYVTAQAAVRVDFDTTALNTNDAAGDSYDSVENIVGSVFGDGLRGDASANSISGNGGADVIYGRDGGDVLDGGTGTDRLYGGDGADSFIFSDGWGADTIEDFDPNLAGENLDLTAVSDITDYPDLLSNHLSSNGSGWAVITAGSDTITLTGVTIGQLSSDDFSF